MPDKKKKVVDKEDTSTISAMEWVRQRSLLPPASNDGTINLLNPHWMDYLQLNVPQPDADPLRLNSFRRPAEPEPEDIFAERDYIANTITLHAYTVQEAMPELRRRYVQALVDTIHECQRLRELHEQRTGRPVRNVKLEAERLVKHVMIYTVAYEEPEEVIRLMDEALELAARDFKLMKELPAMDDTRAVEQDRQARLEMERSAGSHEYFYDNAIKITKQAIYKHNQSIHEQISIHQVQQPMKSVATLANKVHIPKVNIKANPKIDISKAGQKLLENIHVTEGKYVDRKSDPGGKTKYGIAEKREWKKFAEFSDIDANPENIKHITSQQADAYYIHSRFIPFKIYEITNGKVANAIFDQSVLTPGIINRNVKNALNNLGYKFDVNGNTLTEEQISALNSADADTFTEIFAFYQRKYYESLKNSKSLKTRENYKVSITGWINRLDNIKNYK